MHLNFNTLLILRYPGLDDQTIFWNTIRDLKPLKTSSLVFSYLQKCPKRMTVDFLASVEYLNYPERFADQDLSLYYSKYNISTENVILACPLKPCSFSSGSLGGHLAYAELIHNFRYLNATLYSVHANFLTGYLKKTRALMKFGFWLSGDDNYMNYRPASSCKDYVFYEPQSLRQMYKNDFKITKATTKVRNQQ